MAELSKRATDIRKKQYLILGGVGAVLAIVSIGAAVWLQPGNKKVKQEKPTTKQLTLSGAATDKDAWRIQSSAELEKMAKRLQELEKFKADQEMEKAKELLSPSKTESVVAPPAPPVPESAEAFFSQVGPAVPPPPVRAGGALPPGVEPEEPKNRIKTITLDPQKDEKLGGPLINDARRFGATEARRRNERPSLNGKERYYDDDPLTANRAAGRTAETYLPPGSFARAVLLNGLDAPTGGQAQQNPHPVVLMMVDNAQLPNAFRADIKNCFATGNGHGDISSERAYIRLDRISCVDDEGLAVDVSIKGYVSGEDGKAGVRGRLVTKTGQVIANALATGIMSGLGDAMRQSSLTTTTATSTGAQTQTVDNAVQYGLGGGVGKAMDRVAQYYIKLAEQMYPVIEIDGGRVVEIVITRGVSMERKPL